MNLKNQQPVFVPFQFRKEIEQLSKAALMDMVWDYAQQTAGIISELDAEGIMNEFRKRREVILCYREQAKNENLPYRDTIKAA